MGKEIKVNILRTSLEYEKTGYKNFKWRAKVAYFVKGNAEYADFKSESSLGYTKEDASLSLFEKIYDKELEGLTNVN